MAEGKSLTIVVLSRQREITIASTILLLRSVTHEYLKTDIVVIDNGSTDRTVKLAARSGARVISYPHRIERGEVIGKALDIGKRVNTDLFLILDVMGGNTADDALQLLDTVKEKGDDFASAYIVPGKGEDTVGCWAVDRKLIKRISATGNLEDALFEMMKRNKLDYQKIKGKISTPPKRKKRVMKWLPSMGPMELLRHVRRKHPLKFYGGIGMLILLSSLTTGFYSIGYFYTEQQLEYISAFLTVMLVMVGGFFLTAGLMLNSLRVLYERLEATVKWMRRGD